MSDEKKPLETAAPASAEPRHSLEKVSSIEKDKSFDDSNIIEGSEGVTYEELRTLRQVADRLPWQSWVVVFVEFAERFVSSTHSHLIYPHLFPGGLTTVPSMSTTTSFGSPSLLAPPTAPSPVKTGLKVLLELSVSVSKSHSLSELYVSLTHPLKFHPSIAPLQFASFFTYLTPLVGAIVADVYWGRFKTIVVFSIVTMCALL